MKSRRYFVTMTVAKLMIRIFSNSGIFWLRLFLVLCPLALMACTGVGTLDSSKNKRASGATQPRYASFDCGRGRKLVVENFRTSVIVIPPTGESVELLPSPPGSKTRYSEGQDTLIVEGRNAFWFRTGKTPLDCKR